MRKVIIGILMSFCLFGMYQSLWANHSMHPLKQIAFVKKMIGRKQEPYHTAYVQLIRYADSIQQVTHHARNDFAVPGYYVNPKSTGPIRWRCNRMLLPLIVLHWLTGCRERKGMEKKRVIL